MLMIPLFLALLKLLVIVSKIKELKIVEWLDINKLSLNKSKSKYMTFQMSSETAQTLILKIDHIEFNWKKNTEKI